MGVIRITKDFRFETGHALYGYDGKCKNIHGHNFKLSVTVTGSPITDKSHPKYGMVIDFSDLKKIINTEILNKEILLNCVIIRAQEFLGSTICILVKRHFERCSKMSLCYKTNIEHVNPLFYNLYNMKLSIL